ncbi:MAG: 2,3-bisphosphoglycerate-independent phosphoglycerate mutase [Alphaproteobacteria bacterium]|nr:2,3-bisphosphoglycerate-independent phosphoglycerate mutase [Alphaproteobacteria bacterium]
MTGKARVRPVVLCVLDGWGCREAVPDNAISLARTPTFDRLFASAPHARLKTSGLAVGLPEGQMGNSEVGHMNLGAGRVVMQELPRIDAAIADGSIATAPALVDLVARLKASGGRCHLMGLVSPGGVHSHQDHALALAGILGAQGIGVDVHAFLDGRDTPPQSAEGFLKSFAGALAKVPGARLATIAGRYFAMDRDKNWDRVAPAYEAIVAAKGLAAGDWREAVAASYGRGETDEFVKPTVLKGYAGAKDGDGLLFFNFRADRARQILTALVDASFTGFDRPRTIRWAARTGMVSYSAALDRELSCLFPPDDLKASFGELVAARGLRQLRIAETEKYAHVTFFFSGGREEPFAGEERILIPSPKVATYDLKPEMSAVEVTDALVAAIESARFDVVVVNYANPDMVGHTGVIEAAVKAIETVDACVGRLAAAVTAAGGAMLVTADHGNAEQMRDPDTNAPHTAHTTYDVPLLLVGAERLPKGTGLADGRLCDVAPTLLAIMGLEKPAQMSGHSLLVGAGLERGAGGREARPAHEAAER